MNTQDTKRTTEKALIGFDKAPLKEAAIALFECLGYRSQKQLDLEPNTGAGFISTFAQDRPFNREQAMVDDWQSVDFLFQLTDAEIQTSGQGQLPFESSRKYDGAIIQSYLFFAIKLAKDRYTRSQLSAITRSVNRLFDMPVMILFLHGDMLTLSIIRRRLHKRDESKDVLEKVTLIKDIRFADPIRAHIEILNDLTLEVLHDEFAFHSFITLHQAWEKRLDTYQLNERFYRDVSNWYFWALKHPSIIYPRSIHEIGDEEEQEKQRSIFLIRLLTRLIFCWFLQEKGLLPRQLFRRRVEEQMLKDFRPEAGTYYKAFLQNLFFGTLNQEPEARSFRRYNEAGRDGNRGVTNLYRYRDLLNDPDAFVDRLREIPFVNGGLFDCLDQVFRNREGIPNVRLDDFSEEKGNSLCLPNELFFGDERPVDLSDVYADNRRRKESVRGLIEILSRYKFTVEENTPLEQEIALDPELLGKVFENLLASYNEDTRTTARKATGSYYTPREIVGYMVDEALIAYLRSALNECSSPEAELEQNLHKLCSSIPERFENPFSPSDTSRLIEALDRAKILDPACGSGAFLMGALHRMVDILQKLDPLNRAWKEQQLAKAKQDLDLAEQMQDEENRTNTLREIENRIQDIERSFDTRFHALDYARKLYLIENCIYGVDIQPIACQIAKLRFFIALIVDQNVDRRQKNFGVRPLPNLETKIVAADTLIPTEKPKQHQVTLSDYHIRELREQLERVRHDHFNARTPERKERCRQRDAELRAVIAQVLESNEWPQQTSKALAAWDPYDQNHSASFFDPEWMFGIPVGKVKVSEGTTATFRGHFAFMNQLKGTLELTSSDEIDSGFDIVIGNPPYVRQEQIKELKPKLKQNYDCFSGTADLYVYFYERSIKLLRPGGVFSFISSNKWYRSAYGTKLREWLNKNTRVLQLIDFGDAPVFTAISYPTIVILQRTGESDSPSTRQVRTFNWKTGPPIETFGNVVGRDSFSIPQSSLRSDGWQLESPATLRLLDKLRRVGKPLGEYVNGHFFRGVTTGLNDAFIVDREQRDRLIAEDKSSTEVLKPFLRGRDVKRWSAQPKDLWLIFTRRGVNVKRYPAVQQHLQKYQKRLTPGIQGGRKPGPYKWYEIQDSTEYWTEFERPKIIYPDIAQGSEFAFDRDGYMLGNTLYLLPTEETWLLGLLNSKSVFWFYTKVSSQIRGGFVRFIAEYVAQIPVPSQTNHKDIERIVAKILRARKADPSANMSGLEREIDERVYRLYGMTKDEIKMVEESSAR